MTAVSLSLRDKVPPQLMTRYISYSAFGRGDNMVRHYAKQIGAVVYQRRGFESL